MKKYISYLLTLALVIPTLASCSVQMEDIIPSQQKRTVHFSSVNQETRTGLTVGDELVVYDWRKTDIDHVHLFEMDANGQTAYGETIKITPSSDNISAHFEADFSAEDMIIHIDPSTRAGGTSTTERVAPYTYAAVIATKPDTQLSFVVPSVQYPDADTKKDPAAEFLIGYSRKSYEDPTNFDENVVDLYFDRVVSMSRLVISNFKGSSEKVVSVTINAENGLVGSASFADIDFENASVNFVRDEGPGILTLNYGSGVSIPADGTFFAYFVTIPGAATITSMEVLTDQYRYVRSIEGGKEFDFSEKTFKNISVDLNNATAEELGPAASVYTKVMSTSDIEADGTYVIVYDNGSSSKVFKPIVSNDIVEASANNAISATVSDGVLYGDANIDACQVVLVANGSYYHIKFGDYYIYPSQSNIGAESASSSSTRTMAITISNGVATIKRSAYSHYLNYSNYFLRGGSDTNNLALYKLTTGSTTPPTPDDEGLATYTKVTTLTVGETYLIVDADDNLIFKGNINGSYQSVTPVNGVITDDANGTLSAYEFTVEQNGSDYYLKFNDGKYLVSNWNSPGNGSTGLCYVNTQAEVQYPYALTTDNGAFMFSTTQVNSSTSTDQVLYYKTSENVFKIGGSGRGVGIHLYLKGGGGSSSGQQAQTLKFNPTSVSCTLSGTFTQPTLSGAKTTVKYTSSDPNVASVNENTGAVTLKALGTTTITATAVETSQYLAGVASYTLNIVNPPSGDWNDLGTISLENVVLSSYLDAAQRDYEDDNEQTVTYASTYKNQYSSISRQDIPNPVTVSWTNPASSNTVVTIYTDENLSNSFLSPVKASQNATSAQVYNLIPGRKYYYTVSENGTVWEKGYFNTTGRRRMLKISDTKGRGHANNCRDLGGMVTKDGTKRIKYGYIFRGSNMDRTTTTEKSILYNDLNIRLDVDLRMGYGSGNSGSEPDGSSNAYRPFSATNYPEMGYLNSGFNSYNDIVNYPSRVKSVIDAIIDTAIEGNACYFHCWVGADRTGFFGLLIEGMLGISEADCSMDYEMTTFSVVGLRGRDGSGEDHYWGSKNSPKGLALLRSQNGSTFEQKCTNYLISIGVTEARINQFKGIVLVANQ